MAKPPTKAQHVADQLAIKIATGEYRPGQWLPGAEAIGDELGAERGTVRRALLMLAARGLIEIVVGNGAKVIARTVTNVDTTDITQGVDQWRGFGAAAVRGGSEPYVDVADAVEVPVPPAAANRLGIPMGTIVLLRDRVHGVVEGGERQPSEIALTWITMPVVERAPGVRLADTGPGGITARIAEAGYQMRYEDTPTTRMPSAAEQDRLRIDGDQPVLDVWRRTYDQSDHVIKVSNRIINPLLIQLVYRY